MAALLTNQSQLQEPHRECPRWIAQAAEKNTMYREQRMLTQRELRREQREQRVDELRIRHNPEYASQVLDRSQQVLSISTQSLSVTAIAQPSTPSSSSAMQEETSTAATSVSSILQLASPLLRSASITALLEEYLAEPQK